MELLKNLGFDTLTALRFFSRLPIPDWQPSSSHPKLNQAVAAFPLCGLIIALPLAILWYVSNQFLSPTLSATLAVALGVFITGALHEDGLADCADGLGGGSTKERAMEIMRDSTIGTFGGSALIFSIAIRILALAMLSPIAGVSALLIAHSSARAAIAIALYTTDYARSSGMAQTVEDGVTPTQFQLTLTIASIVAFLCSGLIFNALLAPVLGMLAAWAFLHWFKSRIGGYTGDALGAMEQLAEITILITLAAMWS